MSLILSAMLAASMTQATPANNPASWTSDLEYPQSAMQRDEDLAVDFSLLVSPEGRVKRCDITQSSGFPEFDRQTCAALTSRARFKPATDEAGQAVYNIHDGIVALSLNRHGRAAKGRTPSLPAADMELQVQRLPNGVLEESVGIITKVDTTGHVIACEPLSQKEGLARLAEIACSQAKSLYNFITKDDAGNPITLIRSLRVTFKAAPK